MGTRSNLFAKTFPTNATSKENVAPGVHPGQGRVNPTVALQAFSAVAVDGFLAESFHNREDGYTYRSEQTSAELSV